MDTFCNSRRKPVIVISYTLYLYGYFCDVTRRSKFDSNLSFFEQSTTPHRVCLTRLFNSIFDASKFVVSILYMLWRYIFRSTIVFRPFISTKTQALCECVYTILYTFSVKEFKNRKNEKKISSKSHTTHHKRLLSDHGRLLEIFQIKTYFLNRYSK